MMAALVVVPVLISLNESPSKKEGKCLSGASKYPHQEPQ